MKLPYSFRQVFVQHRGNRLREGRQPRLALGHILFRIDRRDQPHSPREIQRSFRGGQRAVDPLAYKPFP